MGCPHCDRPAAPSLVPWAAPAPRQGEELLGLEGDADSLRRDLQVLAEVHAAPAASAPGPPPTGKGLELLRPAVLAVPALPRVLLALSCLLLLHLPELGPSDPPQEQPCPSLSPHLAAGSALILPMGMFGPSSGCLLVFQSGWETLGSGSLLPQGVLLGDSLSTPLF